MKNDMRYIIFFYLTVIFLSISVVGQKNSPTDQPKEPIVTPLTEEERKIDIKNLIANQPDHIATENFFFSEGFGGFSISRKVASRGNRYLIDTGVVTVISEPNKTDIRINRDETFEREVGVRTVFVTPSKGLGDPKDLLNFEDVHFNALGTIDIDGHKCIKIEVTSKSFDEKVFLYAAEDLRNLIIAAQVLGQRQGSVQRLVNISFDVPATLFEIPANYKELPKFNWKKITDAKVSYKGKPVKDALVFRHDEYVFIHVTEFEDFFIDLKKKVADTVVFQGLLVAKDGAYIWRTKESEAISVGELSNIIKPQCDSCVPIRTEGKSVIIPDPDNKRKDLLMVSWQDDY